MRMNRTNVASYVGGYTLGATAPAGTCSNATAADATNDLLCWRTQQAFNALPPTSTANITSNGNFYTVTLTWTDRELDDHAIGYTFQPWGFV